MLHKKLIKPIKKDKCPRTCTHTHTWKMSKKRKPSLYRRVNRNVHKNMKINGTLVIINMKIKAIMI